ncbi:MAG: Polar-differentiation response regulator DivK [Bacteroidetes bacterium ADurb.Bin408]|nr:MAG: Polar-differentiation response regulator DivK [Bacteroidetes bacterium ADurb.Bin408]
MGGSITINSMLGFGTEFIFTLPYEKGASDVSDHKAVIADKKYNWSNKTILLVEDDTHSSDLLKAMLLPAGANIITAVSGYEALSIFKKNKKIDIVLIDYKLPDIDGCEVAKNIRKNDRYIPLIAQTAFATAEDKKRCMNAGFNFFVSKPVNRDLLLNMINNYLV